jgi:hypothetical protein
MVPGAPVIITGPMGIGVAAVRGAAVRTAPQAKQKKETCCEEEGGCCFFPCQLFHGCSSFAVCTGSRELIISFKSLPYLMVASWGPI